MLKQIIRENLWQEFREGKPQQNPLMHFTRFVDFLAYLGTTEQTIKNLCRDDPEALTLWDELGESPTDIHIMNTSKRPWGTSTDAALRRLRNQRPDGNGDIQMQQFTIAYDEMNDERDGCDGQ